MLAQSIEQREEMFESKAGPPRAARPFVRIVVAVMGLAAVFFGVLLARNWSVESTTTITRSPTDLPVMPTSSVIEAMYGVRFLGVDVTAGGGMIQVRYQVIDSAKTEAIHGTEVAPYVVDAKGAKYADPGMVGHSHVGKTLAAGRTDYILLANSMGGVKSGSMVTIKVGDLELRGVPVL
jgi:hypothetical protein